MSNALAESDDEGEIDELNQIGDDFQAMVDGTLLELNIDTNKPESTKDVVYALYPKPNKGFHITRGSAMVFPKALKEIRDYLKMSAFQGFSGGVALVGESNEDGVVFGGNQTVPVAVIEKQIQNMMEGHGKQIAPMVLVLITLEDNRLRVSTIKANEEEIERCYIEN